MTKVENKRESGRAFVEYFSLVRRGKLVCCLLFVELVELVGCWMERMEDSLEGGELG